MRLRPVDLAREHGLSTQAVRNYEEAAVLPPSARSPHGYRHYDALHAEALRTFLKLIPAHGHPTAVAIMQALNAGEIDEALQLIDASHAQLAVDRSTLKAVEAALSDLAPSGDRAAASEAAQGASMFIGPLARRLDIQPATLRKWEQAGLVVPGRDPQTGYRLYGPDDVRDVMLAHQLRRGGHGLDRIAQVLEQVRTAGGPEPLQATLREWHDRLTRRGVAMLAGAAALDSYLSCLRAAAGPDRAPDRSGGSWEPLT